MGLPTMECATGIEITRVHLYAETFIGFPLNVDGRVNSVTVWSYETTRGSIRNYLSVAICMLRNQVTCDVILR